MNTDGLRKRHRSVDLGQREPLHVQDVGAQRARASAATPRCSTRLQRQPGARAARQARRERVVALAARGSRSGARQLGEAEARGRAARPRRRRAPSAAASSWSYQGVKAGGSAITTCTLALQ